MSTKPLRVFCNPWHAPPDHNHRANTAVPWDPHTHSPDRGFVGATMRLDDDGHVYFEYLQFDHELNLLPNAEAVEIPEFGGTPVDRSYSYIQAIKDGALLAADPYTWFRATGQRTGFVDPKVRLAHAADGHELILKQRRFDEFDDDIKPKARPKVGMGKQGRAAAARHIPLTVPLEPGQNPAAVVAAVLKAAEGQAVFTVHAPEPPKPAAPEENHTAPTTEG